MSDCNQAEFPDFSLFIIPKWGKIYQAATKLPNDHKIYYVNGHRIYQMAIKRTKWP
jgi:hypothetical protein